jgi:UDPglucose 6-dehydrogenase/UDP-N-acetyl-D-galactosamine dehydrogenase
VIRELKDSIVCVIGVGYVGLPLVHAFGKKLKVIGFDINEARIKELQPTAAGNKNVSYSSDPRDIKLADFVIICVPTPVTEFKEPDLSPIVNAATTISRNLKPGATVILESTVYPGLTEEIVGPILEKSGLKCGEGFKLAYSPERINPGDDTHSVEKMVKVVAGLDEETTDLVADLYSIAAPSIFKAKNIRTAEAAKAIENTQRDLNIALMNELSKLFDKMGLDTKDVLDAASTKWNFHRYSPGLVGGHCIPVDPYYLVYKAREYDFHPRVITAGRAVNDSMPEYIADMTVKAINSVGKTIKGSRVLIMGLTYKENVPDTRESPARGIIKELREYEINVLGYDPLLKRSEIEKGFDLECVADLAELHKHVVDAVIITVSHQAFKVLNLDDIGKIQNSHPILMDVRRMFEPAAAKKAGFIYRTL